MRDKGSHTVLVTIIYLNLTLFLITFGKIEGLDRELLLICYPRQIYFCSAYEVLTSFIKSTQILSHRQTINRHGR